MLGKKKDALAGSNKKPIASMRPQRNAAENDCPGEIPHADLHGFNEAAA